MGMERASMIVEDLAGKRKKGPTRKFMRDSGKVSKGVLLLLMMSVRIVTPCDYINYTPYFCFIPGSIRFGYRDPSVRPSSHIARATRAGDLGSGIFASKSKWTPATISLQCRSFVPRPRGTSVRRTSKTPSAFFQDSCVTFAIRGVGLAAIGT